MRGMSARTAVATRPSTSRWVLLAILAAAAFLAVACGGGGDKSAATPAATASTATAAPSTPTPSPTPEPNRFDTSKAAALAKASLPAPADLPGGGWKVAVQDEFAQDALPSSAACGSSATAQKAFLAALENKPAGRAQVGMLRSSAELPVPSSASFNVYVYSEAKTAAAVVAPFKALYDSDVFAKCLEEESASLGTTVKVTKATPSTPAPAGGAAAAYDVAISAGAISISMRMEIYAWTSSNAVAGVMFSGTKDVVNATLTSAAITRMQSAMTAAAGGR